MRKRIFYNGKIYVEKGTFAEAVFVEDGVIRAVGNVKDVREFSGSDVDEVDLEGKTVIPGLNDSHMHLLMVGMLLSTADIVGVSSIDEMIERVKDFMKQNPDVCRNGILSMGWNQDFFAEKRLPLRADLDRISTDIPIVLRRVCGHVAVVNSKVIEILGWDEQIPEIEGGTVEVDENGKPNGIVTENAGDVVMAVIPKPTYEDNKRAFLKAADYALAHGITSVQSNDVENATLSMDDTFRMIHEIYDEKQTALRYRHQVCFHSVKAFERYIKDGEFRHGIYRDRDRLDLGPLKLFKDGSLGGRTATMRHEYLDDPGNFGVETLTDEEMRGFCKLADEAGIQIVTHVIGDKAIEDVIGNYEEVIGEGENVYLNALVHCQITDRPMLERIAKSDILVMYQPIFLDYDMHAVISRCGEELASTSYAFKTLADMGVHISYGTDSPVENCNPFPNIYSAVTRKDKNGWPENGFYGAECVPVEMAIDAYTLGSAYNEFKEKRKGRIKAGYLADMVVLDRDIFTCDPMEIRKILPIMTIVDGEIVYKK